MKKEDRIKVWEKYGHHCAYCGKEIKFEDMQVDHFIPKNRAVTLVGVIRKVSMSFLMVRIVWIIICPLAELVTSESEI